MTRCFMRVLCDVFLRSLGMGVRALALMPLVSSGANFVRL